MGKSFAQMTAEEKNHVSHRGNALKNLRMALESESSHEILNDLLGIQA